MTTPIYSIDATRRLLRNASRAFLRRRSIDSGPAFIKGAAVESSTPPTTTMTVYSYSTQIPPYIDRRHSLTHSICHRSRSRYCYRELSSAPQAEDTTNAPGKHSSRPASSHVVGETSSTTTIDGGENEPRKRISDVKISEVLKRKHTLRWVEPVISKDASVREAITLCIERKLNGMMVVDRSETIKRQATSALDLKQKCVGLITSRDILRMMASSIKEGKSPEEVLNQQIYTQMTPINQVIYGRPDETIGMCRAIMAKLGIKCLPILAEGRVEGILTSRDMADFYFDPKDRGGKQNYLRDISERVGLSSDTSMAEPPVFVRQHLALKHAPLFLNVGVVEYPHPFKTADGIGSSRRGERMMCFALLRPLSIAFEELHVV